MALKEIIDARRAYRSLGPVEISAELIADLAEHARLSPSCFNNQPWRYVFVRDRRVLGRFREALAKGNEWANDASMIVVVFTRKELDCDVKGREYFLFDTGMATAFMILRATELGLVAHPIAGYHEDKVKEIVELPGDVQVITLVIVGKHSGEIKPVLSEKQVEWEKTRPERLPLEKFVFFDRYEADK